MYLPLFHFTEKVMVIAVLKIVFTGLYYMLSKSQLCYTGIITLSALLVPPTSDKHCNVQPAKGYFTKPHSSGCDFYGNHAKNLQIMIQVIVISV